MANAAIVITNLALAGTVYASSQENTLPAPNLLTPHPSERWRSTSSPAFFVLDKATAAVADTVILSGMTCGANSTVRLRLSLTDSSGAAGDVLDTGAMADGSLNFDTTYGAFSYLLASPLAWR